MSTGEDHRGPVLQMIYASSETMAFSDQDLLDLLEQTRTANAERNVTGLLLYHDGSFIQVLEGEPSVVRALYDKIVTDPRHHNERVIWEGEQDERSFNDWSMDFHRVDDPEELPEGVIDFLRTGSLDHVDHPDNLVRQVLLGFRDGAYHRGRAGVTDQRVAPVRSD
ncbi:MAG: BLUF domain-containing protein [Actinomycetota bacterium]